jgi:hypothetical protein
MKESELNDELLGSNQPTIPRSFQEDVIDGLFRINLDQQIHDLHTEFCKYFVATQIQTNKGYFAIVFEKEFNVSMSLLNILKSSHVSGLNNLVTYAIVPLSLFKGSYLVAIVEEYDVSNNLAYHIQKYGALSLDIIENKLLPTFSQMLEQLGRLGIACGNINPGNIIILDNGNFMLREFINAYQGFYQDTYYLAPEIAECTELGRSSHNIATDIYAIGVTIFYAMTADEVWSEYKNIYHYNDTRFDISTFKLLVNKRRILDKFKILLKGLLQHDIANRWQVANINDWLLGNHPQTLFDRATENTNLLNFNGHNYSNLKSIAYALFCNWDEALNFIQDDKLITWMVRQNLDNNLINKVKKILGEKRFAQSFIVKNFNELNNKLTDLLSIIDPQGPIRHRGIAFSIYSVPNVLHYLFIKDRTLAAEKILQNLQYQDLFLYKNVSDNVSSVLVAVANGKIQVNDLEKISYLMNPNAICLSSVLAHEFVNNIPDLLVALDKIALQTPSKFFIDRSILAFITARVGTQLESSVKIFSNFPQFSDNPYIHGLCLLSIAHKNAPDIKIANLCNILVSRIIGLFNSSIHNIKFKRELEAQLLDLASEGDLYKIVDSLRDQTRFVNDYNGYYKACKEIEILQQQIRSLAFSDLIFNNALLFGQKLTVLLSYLLCFIVTMILIM